MEYLYIFRSYTKEGTLLKFGYTSDIWARLSQYKSANPGIEIVYIAQLENALELEQAFHKENPSAWGNEWYAEDNLETIMDYLNNIPHIDYTDETRPGNKTDKITFKDVVIECKKGNAEYLALAFDRYDYLEEAIAKIGYKGIEDSKYSVSGVKRKIIRLSTNDDKERIYQYILDNSLIYENNFYEANILKKLFTKIYKDLDIQLTPKAVDIQNYYHTKDHTKKIKTEVNKEIDGKVITKIVWKSVQGFIIVKSKM